MNCYENLRKAGDCAVLVETKENGLANNRILDMVKENLDAFNHIKN